MKGHGSVMWGEFFLENAESSHILKKNSNNKKTGNCQKTKQTNKKPRLGSVSGSPNNTV